MIDWNEILGENDHKALIEQMYAKRNIEEMALHLGVSINALRAKMRKEGVIIRPRGGINLETRQRPSRLDSLSPEEFQTRPIKEIATMFDMYPCAVYKYMRRKGIERKADSGDVGEAEEAGLPGESDVGTGSVDVRAREDVSGSQTPGES